MKIMKKCLFYSIITLVLSSLLLGIYLISKTASNDASWQTQYRLLPTIQLEGDIFTIENLRDFRYKDDESIAKVQYKTESFALSEFKAAWYGISHFGRNGLAHVLLSFEFANSEFDKQYLVVSIEARMRKEHIDGYNPLHGLFRAYTKTIVLATEEDVIGLRTHVRGEPFYLYKLEVPELYTKPLLLNFLREAQVLTRIPTFYNTIVDNCMTGLLAQSDQFRSLLSWIDMRILLPGNSDQIAYELNYINNEKPFSQTREQALVNPNTSSIDSGTFSRDIRSKGGSP